MTKRLSLMVVIPVFLLLSAPAVSEMVHGNSKFPQSITQQSAGVNLKHNWQGNWNTRYGQLRLVQDNNRVYGDYHVRGIIEARVSSDGNILRGVFTYPSGRWGTFIFTKRGTHFQGNWRWNGIAGAGDEKWGGQKVSDVPGPLFQASSHNMILDQAEIKVADIEAEHPGDINANGQLPNSLTSNLALSQVRLSSHELQTIANFIHFEDEDWLEMAANGHKAETRNGPWNGIYLLKDLGGFGRLSIHVVQNGDTAKATAQVSFKSSRHGENKCGQNLHPAFCSELSGLSDLDSKTAAKPTRSSVRRSFIVRGVKATLGYPRSLMIAYQIPGDVRPRILRLVMEAHEIKAKILHADRGVDYTGRAEPDSSLCGIHALKGKRVMMASRGHQRLQTQGFGVFEDRQFLAQFKPRLDRRLLAHQNQLAAKMIMVKRSTHGPHGRIGPYVGHATSSLTFVSAISP